MKRRAFERALSCNRQIIGQIDNEHFRYGVAGIGEHVPLKRQRPCLP